MSESSGFASPLWRAAIAVLIVMNGALIFAISDPLGGEPSDAVGIAGGDRADEPVPATATVEDPTAAPTDTAATPTVEDPTAAPTATESASATPTAVETARDATPGGARLDDVVAATLARTTLPELKLPATGCRSHDPIGPIAGSPMFFECPAGDVVAAEAGRVVMAVQDTEGVVADPIGDHSVWSFERGMSMGRYVVVDHGASGGIASMVSVYSLLADLDPAITVGSFVEAGQVIGQIRDPARPAAQFGWEMWLNDEFAPVGSAPGADISATQAETLGGIAVAPVDAVCAFPSGAYSSLPNASRSYRSGIHRGVDFNCGRGNSAYSFLDGRVTMVVRDFADPPVDAREATLASAAVAGTTPHWILLMLYGNFVVVDHGLVDGVGRVRTIYAHLDTVDENVVLGAPISAGDRLGEIGNRGTNAGSLGTDASVHLHWELFVDDVYLGAGLTPAATEATYRILLCSGEDSINGC